VTPAREPPAARPGQHVDRLFRAAYALSGSRQDAEWLVQAAFMRLPRRRRLVRRLDDAAHLMRALRDAWIELEPASAAQPETSRPEAVDWVVDRTGDNRVLAPDVKAAYHATRELPPRLREAIAAVDALGLSHREAARALGIRQRTLQSRLARARDHVSAALSAGQEAP
jgi:RNA polymerase sigma-70 factor (ECF subfamily)